MSGDIAGAVAALRFKDNKIAYEQLKLLLAKSAESPEVYTHFDDFAEMLGDSNSYIRTRGFLLIAENARWDGEGKINAIIDDYLIHITDDKPITARQCIKALPAVARHKPELTEKIRHALKNADISKYPDSMFPLVLKDIIAALSEIDK